MKFLEKDLEDIIFNTENELLQERGLDIYGKKLRQVNIGNYGVCDLISYERPNYNYSEFISHNTNPIKIWELKKDVINQDTFFQCLSYVKGVSRYLRYRNMLKSFRCVEEDSIIETESSNFFKLCLIGKEVSFKDKTSYLNMVSDNIEIYTYKFDFDGIHFNRFDSGCLKNEGFKTNKK